MILNEFMLAFFQHGVSILVAYVIALIGVFGKNWKFCTRKSLKFCDEAMVEEKNRCGDR